MIDVGLKRVLVWPPVLRALHWLMALTVTALLITGLLLGTSLAADAESHLVLLSQIHKPAGHFLALLLLVRLYLLFASRNAMSLQALLPDRQVWSGIKSMFIFYASLGRAKLPAYFAHNPFWRLLYLILFVLLLWQIATGLLLEWSAMRMAMGLPIESLLTGHVTGYSLIAVWVLLHIVAAVLHDWKGTGSDISGMIHGHRIFLLEKPPTVEKPTSVTIDSIKRNRE